MNKPATEVIHLRIDKDVMDQVRKIAETEDRTINQVIRRLLNAQLAKPSL